MDAEKEREHHVYIARISEQAERYDGKFTFFLTLLFASNNLRIFSFAGNWAMEYQRILLLKFRDDYVGDSNWKSVCSFVVLVFVFYDHF